MFLLINDRSSTGDFVDSSSSSVAVDDSSDDIPTELLSLILCLPDLSFISTI